VGDTIRLGVLAPSVLLAVARRLGRLDRAGPDVTEIPAASPPALLRSLLDGRYDVVLTELDVVLAHRYLEPRSNVMIVSAIDRGLGQAPYANRPGLPGATIGVDGPDSGSASTTFALSRKQLRRCE
jgi:ABC-type nitrate/sulfonate/bicarbonate transport system substrate-binding protein